MNPGCWSRPSVRQVMWWRNRDRTCLRRRFAVPTTCSIACANRSGRRCWARTGGACTIDGFGSRMVGVVRSGHRFNYIRTIKLRARQSATNIPSPGVECLPLAPVLSWTQGLFICLTSSWSGRPSCSISGGSGAASHFWRSENLPWRKVCLAGAASGDVR